MLLLLKRSSITFNINPLTAAKRAQILGQLFEGMSHRAASRLADVSINTVAKLLVDVGKGCAAFQDEALPQTETLPGRATV